MKKNYLINMKTPGAILQMVNNQCTNLQKIHASMLEHAWTESCLQKGDRQTDRVKPISPPPPANEEKSTMAEESCIITP